MKLRTIRSAVGVLGVAAGLALALASCAKPAPAGPEPAVHIGGVPGYNVRVIQIKPPGWTGPVTCIVVTGGAYDAVAIDCNL